MRSKFHKLIQNNASKEFWMCALKLETKNILSFEGIVQSISQAGSRFKDKRKGQNKSYKKIEDFVLSAFSIFYLQCPSFLSYQEAMESDQGNNNARTLFGIEKIPSDNHIRSLLDEESPETLFYVFEEIFAGLVEEGLMKDFRGKTTYLLIAFDGVEYHNSNKINCTQCKSCKHPNGTISYSHSMVTSVVVRPGCSQVIDLPPEFLVPQDGQDKQDSEIAAGKRWLSKHAHKYKDQGVALLGDDLYAHQPFCEAVLEAGFHFIFSCLPKSHKTLYEFIEGLKKTEWIDSVEVKRWTGKRYEFDHYVYVNSAPIRDSEDALLVNWCELTTTDSQGKVIYRNAFATDIKINAENVASIIEDGRARWKTENENNNTLKRHGYHLEHNFGHGKKNLCNVLATLNLIAFLCHTILSITNEAYQKIRKKLGARKKFFEHFRTLTHYILFKNWESMLKFMLNKLKLRLCADTFKLGFSYDSG
jgi:hypothetical protein